VEQREKNQEQVSFEVKVSFLKEGMPDATDKSKEIKNVH
jgi:hypothetical protein